MEWFKNKRFGMFVHWGIYSIPAIHEQYWQRWNISRDEYVKFADEFNPVNFNPAAWLDFAQEAGMEYICFTAKHHDGFCMWDTKQTDFNIMNTPYKKDILALLAEECHKRNIPLVLYYSVVDWHHPAYPNIGRHHEIVTEPKYHNMTAYVDYLKAQITELCSNYGKIYGVWWDMNVPEYKDTSVHQLIRELQPEAVINNRRFDNGDFSTPERDYDHEGANVDTGKAYKMTEACQSVGVNSWGYRIDEDYFSLAYLTESIDTWLAKGCNYLLNVGPTSDGIIPGQSADLLKNIGKWFKPVREGFNGRPERILDDENLLFVRNGTTCYVHCPKGLKSSFLSLSPIDKLPEEAVLLNIGKTLDLTLEPLVYESKTRKEHLRIRNIPVDKLNGPVVIKLKGI